MSSEILATKALCHNQALKIKYQNLGAYHKKTYPEFSSSLQKRTRSDWPMRSWHGGKWLISRNIVFLKWIFRRLGLTIYSAPLIRLFVTQVWLASHQSITDAGLHQLMGLMGFPVTGDSFRHLKSFLCRHYYSHDIGFWTVCDDHAYAKAILHWHHRLFRS